MVPRAVLALGLMDEKGEGLSPRGLKTLIHKNMYFLWFFNDFPKDLRFRQGLKSGFLTLRNEIYEGIGENIWFCGVFMGKRKVENGVSL